MENRNEIKLIFSFLMMSDFQKANAYNSICLAIKKINTYSESSLQMEDQ